MRHVRKNSANGKSQTKKGLQRTPQAPSNIGRSGGIRTRDPLLPKQRCDLL